MGKIYLVGAGPGDPELLTIKALRLLQGASVVLYDRLVTAEILALANPQAEFLYGGKHEGDQEAVQAWIYGQVIDKVRSGLDVVRLKGGDPFVFGRGGEECRFFQQHGIEVEVVPGISSALAAPAAAGIPLTYRGVSRSFAVLAGHCGEGTLPNLRGLSNVDTLVILMGVGRRASIAQELIDAGRDPREPAAFIERATTSGQRVCSTTLGSIAAGGVEVSSPATLVVGAVVGLREMPAGGEEWAETPALSSQGA
ncbi:MAG: uroporphyrinogen-III C-methyltransferase [Bryobacteraceae bacterium]